MFLIRWIARFLLSCVQWSTLCVGAFFLGMYVAPTLESKWLDKQVGTLGETPALEGAAVVPKESTAAAKGSTAAPGPRAPERLAPQALLGRVQIDRLRIDAVVLEGVDEPVLRRAVGHFPGTRLPWQSGTVGLAAHRDSFFRNLRNVAQGDHVRLVTEHGAWSYEVTGTEVVEPDAVHVLDDRETPGLTLVTCYPFDYLGTAPQRFIVTARRL